MSQHRPLSLATHPSPPFRPNSPPRPSSPSYSTPSHSPTSTSPFTPSSSTFPNTTPHFTHPPEHPDPNPHEDAVYAAGSPLSSRLHRRLSGIRAAMAREQLLFGGARVDPAAKWERVEALREADEADAARAHAAHAAAAALPAPPPYKAEAAAGTSHGPEDNNKGQWSPSAEAGEAQRCENGWPGLGLFVEETRRREEKEARESGWGWPGLGWVEYRPGRH